MALLITSWYYIEWTFGYKQRNTTTRQLLTVEFDASKTILNGALTGSDKKNLRHCQSIPVDMFIRSV